MKILELFCGLGGWSKGFQELGQECTGVDIQDLGYPYRFIQADIFDWQPDQDYDIVLASPPCSEFSIIKRNTGTYHYSERIGLDLVWRTFELIKKINPRYWIIENVKGLSEFLPGTKEIIRYGRRYGIKEAYLWGNFPNIPLLVEQIEGPKGIREISGHNPRVAATRGVVPKALSRTLAQLMVSEGK